MNCPVCGSELLFDRCDVKVYRCGYALSTFSELPTIEQACGTQPTAAEPPRPRCETCPLWQRSDPILGICHHQDQDGDNCRGGWYCNQHPGYEVWSKWEHKRRLREAGGGK